MPETISLIKKQYPDSAVELWSSDEHRIGLIPILRRVWVRKGFRPVIPYETRYQWMYLYAFVCPETGKTFWLILPAVSLEVFEIALREFAQAENVGRNKQIILVLDGAGFHDQTNIRIPPGIHLVFLPAYSPELQPAENLWVMSNEGIVNQHFCNLDALEEEQMKRCQQLYLMQKEIKAKCLFDWWPIIQNKSS